MEFLKPDTLNEAFDAFGDDPYASKIIAGGTAVVLMLQNRLIAPERLVSLARVPGLRGIRTDGDSLHIGALTTLREVTANLEIQNHLPALAHACGLVGNVRIRNQATLGGNLAEADYASDPPSVLVALNASVTAASKSGEREIPLNELLLGFYTTSLDPGEIIINIHIPLPASDTRMRYLKYISRSSEDRPCAGVAAVGAFDGDACTDLRIAVGAACEMPQRLSDVEQSAQGQPLSDALIEDIAAAYADQIDTLDDLRGSSWYRTEMIRVHVRRALEAIRDDHR